MLNGYSTNEELLDYINTVNNIMKNDISDNDINWGKIYEIDDHMVNCDGECKENLILLQKLNNLVDTFDSENFSIKAFLIKLQTKITDLHLKNRLNDWINKYNCTINGGLAATINLEEHIGKLISMQLTSLSGNKIELNFKNPSILLPTRGNGNITILDETKAIDTQNNVEAEIDISSGCININLENSLPSIPMILLIKVDNLNEPKLYEFNNVHDTDKYTLIINNLISGKYIIIFEPTN